jgi:hypothetical protein
MDVIGTPVLPKLLRKIADDDLLASRCVGYLGAYSMGRRSRLKFGTGWAMARSYRYAEVTDAISSYSGPDGLRCNLTRPLVQDQRQW